MNAKEAALLFAEKWPYLRDTGIWTGDDLIEAFEIVDHRRPAGNIIPVRNRVNGRLGSVTFTEFEGHKIYHSFREIEE